MLMTSGFDHSLGLVIKGRVNSWTCTCWGKALSSFLQSQPNSARLGEIILHPEDVQEGDPFFQNTERIVLRALITAVLSNQSVTLQNTEVFALGVDLEVRCA